MGLSRARLLVLAVLCSLAGGVYAWVDSMCPRSSGYEICFLLYRHVVISVDIYIYIYVYLSVNRVYIQYVV